MNRDRFQKNKIFRICLIIMGISLLVGVTMFFVSGDYNEIINAKVTYEKSEEVYLDPSINVIRINTAITDVRIKETHEDSIQVHYYGVAVGEDGGNLAVEKVGSEVEIKLEEEVDLSFSFKNKGYYLDVLIPEDYENKLFLETYTSDIQVGRLSVEVLKVKSDEGDIHIDYLNSTLLEILSSTGDTFVKVPDGLGFELTFETQSGEFVTTLPIDKEVYHEKSRFSTIYGDVDRSITYSGESGALNLEVIK